MEYLFLRQNKSNFPSHITTWLNILVAVTLLVIISGSSCRPANTLSNWDSGNDGSINLKFSAQGNLPSDVVAQFIIDYARNLEQKGNGKLSIRTYFGETLGRVDEEVRMLKVGISDIAFVNAGIYVDDLPLSSIAELPFIVPTDRSLPFLNLIFSKYLNKDWTGMHVLFPVWVESLDLFTTRKQVCTVEDLRSMDIRIPSSRALGMIMNAIGAKPVNIPPSETYNALEKGVVTGELSGFTQVLSLKKYSISRYCTRLDYNCGLGAIAMNESKWNMLPREIKKIFEDVAATEQSRFNDMFNRYIQNALATFEESGVTVTNLSPDERNTFYKLTKSASDKIIKGIDDRGLPGSELVEQLLNYRYGKQIPSS